jgi:hypothetical protein
MTRFGLTLSIIIAGLATGYSIQILAAKQILKLLLPLDQLCIIDSIPCRY